MNNGNVSSVGPIFPENEESYESWPSFVQDLGKEDDCGIAGVLRKAIKFHNAAQSMPEFRALRDAHGELGNKSFLGHIGQRLSQLREIQGGQLEAFALLCMVMQEEEEFDKTLRDARCLQSVHAIKLLDDISEIIDRELVPRDDGSPIKIFGMTFTYEHDPIEVRVISRSYELWEQAGKPKDRYQEFLNQAKDELMEPGAPFRTTV